MRILPYNGLDIAVKGFSREPDRACFATAIKRLFIIVLYKRHMTM